MASYLTQFEKWLDGQIQFGADPDKPTEFLGRYAKDHHVSGTLSCLFSSLPAECSARELKIAIRLMRETKSDASD